MSSAEHTNQIAPIIHDTPINHEQDMILKGLVSSLKPEGELEEYIVDCVAQGGLVDVESWVQDHHINRPEEMIRADFLCKLFSKRSHQNLISYQGIKIIGLKTPSLDLNIHFVSLPYPIELRNCAFQTLKVQGVSSKASIKLIDCKIKTARVRNLMTDGDLHFISCMVEDKLRFDNIRVYGDLILRETRGVKVECYGGKVIGEFSANQTHLEELKLYSLEVDGVIQVNKGQVDNLMIEGGSCGRMLRASETFFNSVRIDCFTFKGSLRFSGSKILESMVIQSTTVYGDTFLNDMDVNQLMVWGGHYHGVFILTKSSFHENLIMQRALINGTCFLRDCKLSCDVDFSYTDIHNSLCLESLSFTSEGNTFDLTGVEIMGDLRFFQDRSNVTPHPWGAQTLILRNCSTKSFQDHPDVWPAKVDFTGFEYQHISGRNKRSGSHDITHFADRPISWILDLLGRQVNFNPQPYWQLAKVLNQIGYNQKATRVLYQCAQERRRNNPSFLYRQLKRLHFLVNGYGYYNLRVLYWCGLLIGTGVLVLNHTGESARLGLNHGFLYSIDMLIPIVEFNKKYYTEAFVLHNYFAEVYFFFHEIMGYLLAFMVAAGLTNLSKNN